MTEFEKRGKPTVLFTAKMFVRVAEASARAFGVNSVALAVIPSPGTNQTKEGLEKMSADAIEEVIAGFTSPLKINFAKARPAEVIKYEADDILEAVRRMNKAFLDEDWGDGFPINPATPSEVEKMLKGTRLNPDDVIGVLEPGFGLASIEKIAINAVMAGCLPEHMPIILTAVKIFADPYEHLRSSAQSTAPNAPLVVVNGPIAKQVKINSKCCCLGPGAVSYANTVIGRALRLILMNIGYCYPNSGDMDVQGLPTKYSMVVAENQDDNPWDPYHVERGFAKDVSTVTVHWNYGAMDILDFWSTTPEGVIEKYSYAPGARTGGNFHWLYGRMDGSKEHDFILMGPDHARLFARNGWSKKKVQEALWNKARLPFNVMCSDLKKFKAAHPELISLADKPDSLVPVKEDPECYEIAVVGADVGRSIFCWGKHQPITKAIEGV
jgi:hypothetical protein